MDAKLLDKLLTEVNEGVTELPEGASTVILKDISKGNSPDWLSVTVTVTDKSADFTFGINKQFLRNFLNGIYTQFAVDGVVTKDIVATALKSNTPFKLYTQYGRYTNYFASEMAYTNALKKAEADASAIDEALELLD